jgi:hypothetical protein
MSEIDLIKRNVDSVRARIGRACESAGRAPDAVALCAVTKYVGVPQMRALLLAGIRLIGENRVQDAGKKIQELGRGDFKIHMIGHLQSNKAADAVELFDAVQSVDSVKLARRLDAEAAKRNRTLEIYLQVNSSAEESKSGMDPGGFLEQAAEIGKLDNLDITGVMTIGPLSGDEDAISRAFSLTRNLFEDLRAAAPGVCNLSMGMSGDLELAVAHGATLVRVGSALYQGL